MKKLNLTKREKCSIIYFISIFLFWLPMSLLEVMDKLSGIQSIAIILTTFIVGIIIPIIMIPNKNKLKVGDYVKIVNNKQISLELERSDLYGIITEFPLKKQPNVRLDNSGFTLSYNIKQLEKVTASKNPKVLIKLHGFKIGDRIEITAGNLGHYGKQGIIIGIDNDISHMPFNIIFSPDDLKEVKTCHYKATEFKKVEKENPKAIIKLHGFKIGDRIEITAHYLGNCGKKGNIIKISYDGGDRGWSVYPFRVSFSKNNTHWYKEEEFKKISNLTYKIPEYYTGNQIIIINTESKYYNHIGEVTGWIYNPNKQSDVFVLYTVQFPGKMHMVAFDVKDLKLSKIKIDNVDKEEDLKTGDKVEIVNNSSYRYRQQGTVLEIQYKDVAPYKVRFSGTKSGVNNYKLKELEKVKKEDTLKVGDQVQIINFNYDYYNKQGTVSHINTNSLATYPFTIKHEDNYNYAYKLEDLRKVNRDKFKVGDIVKVIDTKNIYPDKLGIIKKLRPSQRYQYIYEIDFGKNDIICFNETEIKLHELQIGNHVAILAPNTPYNRQTGIIEKIDVKFLCYQSYGVMLNDGIRYFKYEELHLFKFKVGDKVKIIYKHVEYTGKEGTIQSTLPQLDPSNEPYPIYGVLIDNSPITKWHESSLELVERT